MVLRPHQRGWKQGGDELVYGFGEGLRLPEPMEIHNNSVFLGGGGSVNGF